MKKTLLLILCFCSIAAFAQKGTIRGKVLDQDTKEGLVGATVTIAGTSTGSVVDIEGDYALAGLDYGTYSLLIKYVGYTETKKTVVLDAASVTVPSIELGSSSVGLDEVMVLASVAIDRETPVAVSTIKAAEIESKIGSQEFPEILKSTPGVYATKSGGGFGDGRINIRGFDSENVAVMINGIPVNDMENGRVFWSNWAGLTDVTSNMQVQRGLGAAKVAVPSIGGTINIISKATERETGGSVYLATGNDEYQKIGLEVNSGLSDNGWAFTLAGSRTAGNGYVDGTEFSGYSYYATIAKIINDKHELNLTAIGAIQRHGQRQNRHTLDVYEASDRGIKFNSNWGYLNGQLTQVEDNFYHKPQISLNHYWTISNRTELSTAAYASFGSGGGGGALGADRSKLESDLDYRKDGLLDLDRISEENAANGALGSSAIMRASRNDHNWYGLLSTLSHEVTGNLTFLGGLDLRYYRGKHYREVTNLLGGSYYLDDDNVNNPINAAQVGDRIDYNNDGIVNWTGLFAQVEYKQNDLSAFVSLSGSNTGYSRVDYFNYLDSDDLQTVGTFNYLGYMAKGGANYNFSNNWNAFFNLGYFTKAPNFDAVFPNFNNEDLNIDAENQKIFSAELGVGYRSSNFTANLNVYRTEWLDRTYTDSFDFTRDQGTEDEEDDEEITVTANFLGVDALHQGIEFDMVYEPMAGLKITGMASFGDWTWTNNVTDVGVFDETDLITTVDAYIAGSHVGDAAQTTAALGLRYEVMKDLIFGVDYNYYARLYAQFDPVDRDSSEDEGVEAWRVPSYGLVDLNMTYNFDISDFNSSLYVNVYNVGNTEYVADAQDGANNDALTSTVYYGYGINWNLGLRIRF